MFARADFHCSQLWSEEVLFVYWWLLFVCLFLQWMTAEVEISKRPKCWGSQLWVPSCAWACRKNARVSGRRGQRWNADFWCCMGVAAAEVTCTSPARGQPRHDRGRGEAPGWEITSDNGSWRRKEGQSALWRWPLVSHSCPIEWSHTHVHRGNSH